MYSVCVQFVQCLHMVCAVSMYGLCTVCAVCVWLVYSLCSVCVWCVQCVQCLCMVCVMFVHCVQDDGGGWATRGDHRGEL